MKWDVKRFAITGGIVWGLCLFAITLLNVYTGGVYGKAFLEAVASIYPGYSISLMGSIVGLIYGFVDICIGTYIFVWIYKRVSK